LKLDFKIKFSNLKTFLKLINIKNSKFQTGNNKSRNSGKFEEPSTSQNNNYESEEQEIQDYENDFNFLKDFEENVNKQNNIPKSKRKHIEENLNDLEENVNKQFSILETQRILLKDCLIF